MNRKRMEIFKLIEKMWKMDEEALLSTGSSHANRPQQKKGVTVISHVKQIR